MLRKTLLGALFSSVLLSVLIPIVTGEVEPNNSLDQTNTVGETWTTGHVDYQYGNDLRTDRDFYRVELPANMISVLTLKNTESGRYYNEIYLGVYNQYRESDEILWIEDRSNDYELDDGMYVDEPGAEVRGFVVGAATDSFFFIMISGEGNYSVKSHLMVIPDTEDPPFPVRTVEATAGTYLDRVYKMTYESITIMDQDQYLLRCNKTNFRFRIEKTGDDLDPLNVKIISSSNLPDWDSKPDAILGPKSTLYEVVSLYDDYENEKLYGDNIYMSHSNNKLWYITIWGEGTYNLTIEWFPLLTEDDEGTDDDDDDDIDDDEKDTEVEAFYVVGCMISSLLVPLLFVVLIVLTMVLIFKKGKKEEKAEAGTKSSSTIDDPAKYASSLEQKGKDPKTPQSKS